MLREQRLRPVGQGLLRLVVHLDEETVGTGIFQKKPEFGPASMKVNSLEMERVSVPYLLEEGSRLVLDGQKVAANRTTVKDELYGKRYGRASRR